MNRRTGQTTRIVDDYIQELFTKGSITVVDNEDTYELNRRVTSIIKKRLIVEHNHLIPDGITIKEKINSKLRRNDITITLTNKL